MCSEISALQSMTLSLMECIWENLGEQIAGYIDPNTMHHVFTFLGPILALFTAVASVVISAVFFLRYRLASWFRKASGLKLFIAWLVLMSIAVSAIVAAYKLILHLTTH